jgi:hypothetical protein
MPKALFEGVDRTLAWGIRHRVIQAGGGGIAETGRLLRGHLAWLISP